MKYYVVNTENRRVLFGPFEGRTEADNKHYDICAFGIPDVASGNALRPRCAVVSEGALTPNELGNHYKAEGSVINGGKNVAS